MLSIYFWIEFHLLQISLPAHACTCIILREFVGLGTNRVSLPKTTLIILTVKKILYTQVAAPLVLSSS